MRKNGTKDLLKFLNKNTTKNILRIFLMIKEDGSQKNKIHSTIKETEFIQLKYQTI